MSFIGELFKRSLVTEDNIFNLFEKLFDNSHAQKNFNNY